MCAGQDSGGLVSRKKSACRWRWACALTKKLVGMGLCEKCEDSGGLCNTVHGLHA
jgi:hypothetical protein